jgi:hypothetical protein
MGRERKARQIVLVLVLEFSPREQTHRLIPSFGLFSPHRNPLLTIKGR